MLDVAPSEAIWPNVCHPVTSDLETSNMWGFAAYLLNITPCEALWLWPNMCVFL